MLTIITHSAVIAVRVLNADVCPKRPLNPVTVTLVSEVKQVATFAREATVHAASARIASTPSSGNSTRTSSNGRDAIIACVRVVGQGKKMKLFCVFVFLFFPPAQTRLLINKKARIIVNQQNFQVTPHFSYSCTFFLSLSFHFFYANDSFTVLR